MNLVHGHEVMQLISRSDPGISREDLIKQITKVFGPDTGFYNCSTSHMDAAQIVAFFEGKGKIRFSDEGIRFGAGSGCNH